MIELLSLKIPGPSGPIPIEPPKAIPTGGLENGGTGAKLIQNSITILLITILFLSFIFIILGGIQWITSGGDKARTEGARKKVLYAILGFALALISFVIVTTVGRLVGVDNILAPSS